MNTFLKRHFKSDDERIDYHLFIEKSFEPKTQFLIGLDGMICEETILKGQDLFDHLFSALGQTVDHWTSNFQKNNFQFRELWSEKEWSYLLEYEMVFIENYRNLIHWKRTAPSAPKLFQIDAFVRHKQETQKLFNKLTSDSKK